MKNAMTRMKQHFTELRHLIGAQYNMFELNGKDAHASIHNDRGYTKAVVSDFIRVFKALDKSYSFSFAFNNPERDDLGGVIVSAQINKDPYLKAYFSFEEFKSAMNNLIKAMKLTVNSSDRLDYPKVHELMVTVFGLTLNELNLDSFVDNLVINLKQTEDEYLRVARSIDLMKKDLAEARLLKSKEEYAVYKKEIKEFIANSESQINKIETFYRNLVRINKASLMREKTYISSRLLGRLVASKINEVKVLPKFKQMIQEELDALPTYISHSEIYSD